MARDKSALLPLALSPTHCAHVLGVAPALIYSAIKAGHLAVYRPRISSADKPQGNKRKLLVPDVIDYVRQPRSAAGIAER
jgi:hypothetical protein